MQPNWAAIEQALGAMRVCIRSGEPWTAQMERAFEEGWAAVGVAKRREEAMLVRIGAQILAERENNIVALRAGARVAASEFFDLPTEEGRERRVKLNALEAAEERVAELERALAEIESKPYRAEEVIARLRARREATGE